MVAEVIKMKEEKRGLKNHWKQIVRKKGFFPALYLVIAAILLTGVLWYQNLNRVSEPDLNLNYQDELRGENPLDLDEPSEPATTPVENVSLPILSEENTQIVTKFYEHGIDQEEQEQALVFYNNNYYQSQGIDIAATNEDPLQVVAALSGEVIEVKEDPLLGYVVQIEHEHDVTTYYSSLTDVEVEPSQKVSQGDIIAHAGTSLFSQDKGIHVHFEIRKDGQPVNPESFLDQPVTDITVEETADVSDDPTDQDLNQSELEPDQSEPEPEQSNPEPDQSDQELESGITTTHT